MSKHTPGEENKELKDKLQNAFKDLNNFVDENGRLRKINADLLALLKDILGWGILPHSKTRIRQAIAKAEVNK